MRIALLNLPVDNNYGGNLQRYALIKVLQDMGYDVTHLNLRFCWQLPWYKKPFSYSKRIIKWLVLGRDVHINQEKYQRLEYIRNCSLIEPFYQKYIKHSDTIFSKEGFLKYLDYDAYIVGSDQVWRKKIALGYLSTMFLDFIPRSLAVKRIAYGVSLGTSENELSQSEINKLGYLYKQFNSVSVRELSAIPLLSSYGWRVPEAVKVLDPTFLLNKEDYIKLINDENTDSSGGVIFCYILDMTKEKEKIIENESKKQKLPTIIMGLKSGVSIERWLSYFLDAKSIITDSYHGLVFSIIFNKPYKLIRNQFRGNARFDSVLNELNLSDDGMNVNWRKTNEKMQELKLKSIRFLNSALSM